MEELVIKMGNGTPKAVLVKSTFGKEAMDMRVPFEITAKSMQDTDKTGNKISFMIANCKLDTRMNKNCSA